MRDFVSTYNKLTKLDLFLTENMDFYDDFFSIKAIRYLYNRYFFKKAPSFDRTGYLYVPIDHSIKKRLASRTGRTKNNRVKLFLQAVDKKVTPCGLFEDELIDNVGMEAIIRDESFRSNIEESAMNHWSIRVDLPAYVDESGDFLFDVCDELQHIVEDTLILNDGYISEEYMPNFLCGIADAFGCYFGKAGYSVFEELSHKNPKLFFSESNVCEDISENVFSLFSESRQYCFKDWNELSLSIRKGFVEKVRWIFDLQDVKDSLIESLIQAVENDILIYDVCSYQYNIPSYILIHSTSVARLMNMKNSELPKPLKPAILWWKKMFNQKEGLLLPYKTKYITDSGTKINSVYDSDNYLLGCYVGGMEALQTNTISGAVYSLPDFGSTFLLNMADELYNQIMERAS